MRQAARREGITVGSRGWGEKPALPPPTLGGQSMDIQNYEIGGLEETIEPASNLESSIFGVLYQGIYQIYSPY
jgi:hypothetical protein